MKEIFKTWYKPLAYTFEKPYFNTLFKYLNSQYDLSAFSFNKLKIYPKDKKNVFKCFNCNFDKLQVVIIGSEPFGKYSEGLAFDSNPNLTYTAGMADIFQFKIEQDCHNGLKLNLDYSLEYLMEQNVLLLNESLTMIEGKSHKKLWKEFITDVINTIQNRHTGIIFCIQKNSDLINLIDIRTQYLLEYTDPKSLKLLENWDLDFNMINTIIESTNGVEYKINF